MENTTASWSPASGRRSSCQEMAGLRGGGQSTWGALPQATGLARSGDIPDPGRPRNGTFRPPGSRPSGREPDGRTPGTTAAPGGLCAHWRRPRRGKVKGSAHPVHLPSVHTGKRGSQTILSTRSLIPTGPLGRKRGTAGRLSVGGKDASLLRGQPHAPGRTAGLRQPAIQLSAFLSPGSTSLQGQPRWQGPQALPGERLQGMIRYPFGSTTSFPGMPPGLRWADCPPGPLPATPGGCAPPEATACPRRGVPGWQQYPG